MSEDLLSIGELSERAGVPTSTLRYYDEVGLLDPASREPSGRRRYSPDAEFTLRMISCCKAAGLELEEIRTVLADRSPRGAVRREIAVKRLANVHEQMQQLRYAEQLLELAIECRCDTLTNCNCSAATKYQALVSR